MEKLLTIRHVSELTGLSAYTLRYYEDIGLLGSIPRDENGHRCFSTEDITWIDFLSRLKATGMPIAKMVEFADLKRTGESTLTERRIRLEEHFRDVEQRVLSLQQNLSLLAHKIDTYREMESDYLKTLNKENMKSTEV